jgi:prefoldin subunit 5
MQYIDEMNYLKAQVASYKKALKHIKKLKEMYRDSEKFPIELDGTNYKVEDALDVSIKYLNDRCLEAKQQMLDIK